MINEKNYEIVRKLRLTKFYKNFIQEIKQNITLNQNKLKYNAISKNVLSI